MSKLPHIQILRAFAALCVVAFHAQNDAAVVAARLGTNFATSGAFPWLAGVDVFFVISGFIMVYASSRWFGSEGAPRVFLAHRLARIVPLYWVTTAIYLAVVFFAPALLNSEYLEPRFVAASFFFIPAPRPDGTVQPLYSLGWTLNYEMFFYGLFAVAVMFPRRRALPTLICALILIVGLGKALGPLPQPFGFWSDPIILEFAFGAAIGWARIEGAFLNPPARLCLSLLGLALLAGDLTRPAAYLVLSRPLAYGVPASLLVASAAFVSPAPREGRNAMMRAGVLLGDASYALYLLHPFVIRALRELVTRSGSAHLIGAWGFVVLCVAVAAVVAVCVNRLFERPLTAAVRRSLEPRHRPAFENVPRKSEIEREPSAPLG